MASSGFDLGPGSPVVLYLHTPKEKVWGIVISMVPAGIVVRGIDLVIFDDWMRQEARGGEALLGATTVFYPMHRLERMERDENAGPLEAYADRFSREVGRTVWEALGLDRAGGG